MSKTKTPNHCFGCGDDNAYGMHLKFSFSKKRACVTGKLNLDARFAGPPGYCHGGIIATILDEAMAKLNKLHGVTAVTGHLAVEYLRPVSLSQPLHLKASEVYIKGRQRFREGEISNKSGEVLARGRGVFITIDPQKMFAKKGNET